MDEQHIRRQRTNTSLCGSISATLRTHGRVSSTCTSSSGSGVESLPARRACGSRIRSRRTRN